MCRLAGILVFFLVLFEFAAARYLQEVNGDSSSTSEDAAEDNNTDTNAFMSDDGQFDLTKWQEHMRPCQDMHDEDARVKCMNDRQPFMTFHRDPHVYPGGALPPPDEPWKDLVAADEPAATTEVIVPSSFDIRERWPECLPIFNRIRNQPCNNCWAFSSTSVMSDRICIASGAKTKVLLSADDLTTCCASCQALAHKCDKGGYPEHAFKHWIKQGIVTEMCKPTHKLRRNASQECVQQCKDPRKDYAKSKHYGQGMLRLSNATRIQQEIFANGSVEAMFVLHKDLYKYKEGIYIPVLNGTNKAGYHSVRLIGWGELSVSNHSLPYWIAVNSWGRRWGENGTFRIIRGINAAHVEQYVIAGYPLL